MSTDFRGLWMVAGAWLAAWFNPPTTVYLLSLGLCGLLFALAARRRHDARYASPWFTSPLLMLLAALAVMTPQLHQQPCQLPELDATGQLRVLWRFQDTPRSSEDGAFKGRAEITQYWEQGHWVHCPVQVYLSSTAPPPAGSAYFESVAELEATEPGTGFEYWAQVSSTPKGHGTQLPDRADTVKAGFASQLSKLPETARALLPGMLYGDRSLQDDQLSEAMKATGLSHLTAVSGSNCAIIGGIALLVLRALGAPRALALFGLGAVLWLFTALVGPEPSVLRAALMGGTAAVSLHFGRGRASLGILCLSATVLLVISPKLAGEPAFALSVLATVGIIVFAPVITDYLGGVLPRILAEPIAMCAAAQLTCLPVVIALSERFSLYSIPLNLVVTPAISIITIVGMLCVLLVFAFPGLVSVLVWVPALPAWGIAELALAASKWPGAVRPWPAGVFGVLLAVLFTVVLCIAILNLAYGEQGLLRSAVARLLMLTLVGLCALVLPATLFFRPAIPEWQIAMCDVGQGDALVVQTAPGTGWLIDTGPAGGGVVSCLQQLGISTLSKVFITHNHADHTGGLEELENSTIEVDSLLVPETFEPAALTDAQRLVPGDTAGEAQLHYTVLGLAPIPGVQLAVNDTSLVLRIDFTLEGQGYSFFSAGDMESDSMARLLKAQQPQPVTVLKASHHGARNGGTELLEQLKPRLLLISAGAENSYGHPHQEILDTARSVGAQVLRTDQHGTVTITFADETATATTIGVPVR